LFSLCAFLARDILRWRTPRRQKICWIEGVCKLHNA
jgi:hypothetical protein